MIQLFNHSREQIANLHEDKDDDQGRSNVKASSSETLLANNNKENLLSKHNKHTLTSELDDPNYVEKKKYYKPIEKNALQSGIEHAVKSMGHMVKSWWSSQNSSKKDRNIPKKSKSNVYVTDDEEEALFRVKNKSSSSINNLVSSTSSTISRWVRKQGKGRKLD